MKHWREAIKLLLVSVVLLLLSGCNTSSVSTMNINIKKGANFGPGSKVFVEARDGDVASLTVKMMNHLMSNGYSVTDLSDADFRVDYSYGYTKINTNYVHDVGIVIYDAYGTPAIVGTQLSKMSIMGTPSTVPIDRVLTDFFRELKDVEQAR